MAEAFWRENYQAVISRLSADEYGRLPADSAPHSIAVTELVHWKRIHQVVESGAVATGKVLPPHGWTWGLLRPTDQAPMALR